MGYDKDCQHKPFLYLNSDFGGLKIHIKHKFYYFMPFKILNSVSLITWRHNRHLFLLFPKVFLFSIYLFS